MLQRQIDGKQNRFVLNLCPGDTVEVRNDEEIRRTLEADESLDGLPFMPEMTKYCGGRFKVLTPVDRTIVEGIGNRRMHNTVILKGVTCDGHAHEGCQRTCQVLWKEDWLRRVDQRALCTHLGLSTNIAKKVTAENSVGTTALCQLAGLPNGTHRLPISFEDFVRQYLCCHNFAKSGIPKHVCDFLLFFNFKVQRARGRKRYAMLHGKLRRTPSVSLELRPGDSVEVKSKQEILATLDVRGRNRGLAVTDEMLKYCGGKYRVMKRVDRMISERTNKIRPISNTVILEGVTCDGSDPSHGNCPRRCYCLWREIWLKRT